MPYEVSMSGGSPWGFRLSGGPLNGKPTAVSRITPGGKAAQANVMQGDALIAINGFDISHLDLPEIMEMIRISGWTLHMTLISQDEIIQVTKKKRVSETNITAVSELERPRSQLVMTPMSERASRASSRLSGACDNQDSLKIEVSEDSCESNNHEIGRSESVGSSSAVSPVSPTTVVKSPKNLKGIEICVQNTSKHVHKMTLENHSENLIHESGLKSTRDSCNSNVSTRVDKVGETSHGIQQGEFLGEAQEENEHSETQHLETPESVDAEDMDNLPQPPAPMPRTRKLENDKKETEKHSKPNSDECLKENLENTTPKMPDYIRRQLKPPKKQPVYNPKMSWLHDKLKISPKKPNGLSDPGNSLKIAAAAYPCQRIEIEGPLSATIVHSQYNTPVGMYSANQIVNTLVNTAAAQGADMPDPEAFGDQHVDVDMNTPVYKMVHDSDRASPAPAQSRSIKILDALLEHGREMPRRIF